MQTPFVSTTSCFPVLEATGLVWRKTHQEVFKTLSINLTLAEERTKAPQRLSALRVSFGMGQRLSRGFYTPLKDVTVRQLAGSSGGGGNFLLSPAFCLKVLKRGLPPHYECSNRELARFGSALRFEKSEVWREKQRKVEDRLWAAMTRRKPTREGTRVDFLYGNLGILDHALSLFTSQNIAMTLSNVV